MEILPAKIKSNRRRCPRCHAPTTDIGTCPYCHEAIGAEEEIYNYTYLGRYLHLSHIVKKKKYQLKPKSEYKIIKKKGFHKGEVTRVLRINKDIVNSFFNNYSNDYKINFDASIQIRLKTELNEVEAAVVGRGNKTLGLLKVDTNPPCECGCHDIALDHERGETFCPGCGLISETSMISEFLEGK